MVFVMDTVAIVLYFLENKPECFDKYNYWYDNLL